MPKYSSTVTEQTRHATVFGTYPRYTNDKRHIYNINTRTLALYIAVQQRDRYALLHVNCTTYYRSYALNTLNTFSRFFFIFRSCILAHPMMSVTGSHYTVMRQNSFVNIRWFISVLLPYNAILLKTVFNKKLN